jgi:hypothetical protein
MPRTGTQNPVLHRASDWTQDKVLSRCSHDAICRRAWALVYHEHAIFNAGLELTLKVAEVSVALDGELDGRIIAALPPIALHVA